MSLLDFNFNFNAGVPPSAVGLRCRPRYNSDLESRLVDTAAPDQVVPAPAAHPPNYPPFHEFWDADLRAYMYLDDFLAKVTPAWRASYAAAARDGGKNIPPGEMTRHQLGGAAVRILELALERESRFAEIIDQDDADGAINYWLGMLKIDPGRHPATNLMVHVGRRIGEHVAMCLKGDFRSPRPSQVCPAITPMIDPPATPSFPAGHAVQSYLISYLLAYSLKNLPQHVLPASLADAAGPLFDLAARVSQNRVVAGVHYHVDIDAGKAVAIQAFTDLQNVVSVWGAAGQDGLRQQVQKEFSQYA